MTNAAAARLTLLVLASSLSGCFGGSGSTLSETGRRIQDMNERALGSMEKQRFDDARAVLDEALRIAASLDDADHQALSLLNLARLERRLGRLDQAEALLVRALKPGSQTGYRADLAQEAALLKLAQNRLDDAKSWAETALKEEQGEMKGRRLNLLARIALLQGKGQEAFELSKEAFFLTGGPQMAGERANALRTMAQVRLNEKLPDEAERLLNEALDLDRSLERPAMIAADLEALARVMQLKGDSAKEQEYHRRAHLVRKSLTPKR